ncbi:hypothetical protein RB653_004061 [Dictyostelium firmibasis]|uniref:Saposin B-type domain-containing protein n=1 Tax=Dictyostelium firmibasis TaxID=79012 RepID=A0AAN7U6R6_9MYCE
MIKYLLTVIVLLIAISSGNLVSSNEVVPCEVCNYVITMAEVLVEQNRTESYITDTLEKVCNIIPRDDYKSTCRSIVTVYTKDIIQLIINREPSEKICEQIKVCPVPTPSPTRKIEQPILAKRNEDNTLQCTICKLVATKLEGYIQSNKTIQEIEAELDDFCKIAFEKDPTQCQGFVQQYVPMILSFIKSKEDPTQACIKLKFCTSSRVTKSILSHHVLINKNY